MVPHLYSDDIVAVPGYSFSYHGLISAGVFVQAGLTGQGSNINMKVSGISMNSKAHVKSC